MEDRYITLVIHTLSRALALRTLLENHGIETRLEKIDLPFPMQKEALRVKILQNQLPLALKIIESGDTYSPNQVEKKLAGMSGNLLIPVDFSNYALLSCRVGFDIAARLSLHPVILHSYIGTIFPSASLGNGFEELNEVYDAEENQLIEKSAEKRMEDFKKKLTSLQSEGGLARIKFSTLLTEGVPEDVILEYSKESPPSLVVMATRGKHKKEEELIGSVTAEVLDSCRVPIVTVPENHFYSGINNLKRLLLFCNLDDQDLLAVDSLMKLFEFPEVEIHLVSVNDRLGDKLKDKLERMKDILSSNYPTAEFIVTMLSQNNFRSSIGEYIDSRHIQLLVVPNKKTNIFNRIFKPTLARKCLFERDMPLLALPV